MSSGGLCPECNRHMPDPLEPCPSCAFTPAPVSSGGSLEGEAAKRAAERVLEALAEARKRSKEKQQ